MQSAVGMLRDQNESCTRNMRRVVLLLDLLNEDSTCHGMSLPTPLAPAPTWALPEEWASFHCVLGTLSGFHGSAEAVSQWESKSISQILL